MTTKQNSKQAESLFFQPVFIKTSLSTRMETRRKGDFLFGGSLFNFGKTEFVSSTLILQAIALR